MNIDDESKIIVEAIDKTIKEVREYNNIKEYRTEALMQFRLYHHICNALGKDHYKRISGECSPLNHEGLMNYADSIYKKSSTLYIPYMEHIYNRKKEGIYDINKNIEQSEKKELSKTIIKQGKYDIVIFDGNCKKIIKHVIEVKKLKESYINPEGRERHRALEDIYELSDFINPNKFNKNIINKDAFKHDFTNIHEDCRGYNLMFVCEEWKRPLSDQNKKKYEKMKTFIKDIKNSYKDADIHYLAIGFDEDVAKNLGFTSMLTCGY